MARQMGFDLVQGFLFRDRFIRRGCLVKPTERQKQLA
jgi:hypothetical protein